MAETTDERAITEEMYDAVYELIRSHQNSEIEKCNARTARHDLQRKEIKEWEDRYGK